MNIVRLLSLTLLASTPLAAAVSADDSASYASESGSRVTVFENPALNYRLNLDGREYTFVDFSKQMPDASFAAVRFRPNAFSLVIVEQLGSDLTSEEYAELVQVAMTDRFAEQEESEFVGYKDLGSVDVGGMRFFQKVIYAQVGTKPATYVVSAIVDGARSYQLLSFGIGESEDAIREEATAVLSGFSIIDSAANLNIESGGKSVKDYRSGTFGYRFQARRGWVEWTDLKDTNEGADIGALSASGFGAVVMPVCWKGSRPRDNAIFSIVMQQFGEDYPSDFISEESDVSKDGASGKLLVGIEANDGEEYLYHQWIVANEHCAYALAAWGPVANVRLKKTLAKLWSDFEIGGEPSALLGQYDSDSESEVNAYLLNALGLHYYGARSFRDAYDYFSHASDLSPADEAYLLNAIRSLVEVNAYAEARDFLLPRLGPFADHQEIQSWDAWLAYQTNDPEKAMRIYDALFAAGYREDDDFSAYLTMLADAEQWPKLDQVYKAYTDGGINDKTRLLQVQLLSRRQQYDKALALLEEMTAGRPFNADLVYERIAILDDKGEQGEVLQLARSLIDNGYKSLQSYYYKGNAEYQLRSYADARESFKAALVYAPGNTNVREYIDAIDLVMGQGDVSTISEPIVAVRLPGYIQKIFDADDAVAGEAGYGADFLSRISSYEFSGGETRTETLYRKIRVTDDNGISQFSTLEFDFDPSYESLFVNSLVVRDANGAVLGEGELQTYYITNNEDSYEASTEKTVHLPVPSLVPGAIIEAVVSKLTHVDENAFPLETVYMASDRPVAYSALVVSGKHDAIRYETNDMPKPKERGGALVWELQSPQSYRWEPLQPYFDQILPWVQLGTVGENWKSVGVDYLDSIKDKIDVESVSERASRLVDGVSSESRKIEILSAYVQDEIHYEAIEFGRRAYIPKTARETLRDRYGDCKDHALLLYSMLESVGIDASLALVNLQQSVIPNLPNTDQFNHMIVAIPTGDGRVFIDTTDKDMRLGEFAPRSMAGNHALLLNDAPQLVAIPDYESDVVGLAIERIVEPGEDGFLRIRETAQLSGYQAAELRGQLRSIETSEMQSSLQRWVADRYSDAELTDYGVENVFDAGYDLIIEFEYTLPIETDGSFDVPSFLESYYLEYDRIADRRFPFEFSYPLRVSANTSVRYPAGRDFDILSKQPLKGESKFGNWRREVTASDGLWRMTFDYVASEARFRPEDYREFAEFQRKAVDAIEASVLIQ